MSEDVRILVGSNVRRVRMAVGLTQAQLAVEIGVDRSYISGLELGTRNATIFSLARVAERLKVPISEFFVGAHRPR